MAKTEAVATQALRKLEDQLTCAICLDTFKNPKLLQCFHVFCKDCLERLVVQDQQSQLSLRCPTCRRSTLLPPASTVSDLQPAFHIHHLIEIQDAFEKVKEPQKVQCGRCTKSTRTATSYCRDCGEFICARCADVHGDWDMFSNHEVVPLDQFEKKVKQLDALRKVTLYCSLHQGKELELYCETCEELICLLCTVKKHKDHQYDLVGDTFEQQKAEIVTSLEPVEMQLDNINKALEQIDTQSKAISSQRDTIEADVQKNVRELHELLELRKAELIDQLDQMAQQKLKNLASQKEEVETVQTQLVSCQSFVKESLRTGSQGEVMKMKRGVIRQIKEVTDSIEQDKLPPCESPDIGVSVNSVDYTIKQFCSFYTLRESYISVEKSYISGKGLKVATQGERATAVVHINDGEGRVYSKPVKSLTCELRSDTSDERIKGSVKKTEGVGQTGYEISYQPTRRGRYQLHVELEGKHIKGSPFTVHVVRKFDVLISCRSINGLKDPWGVAINQQNEVVVVECGRNCVSIFKSTGEKIRSFGSHGNGSGQFNRPCGVAVDDNGNILVVDGGNHCIQKFTADGRLITAVGTWGTGQLQFNSPIGIKINPNTKNIYVADSGNHRIQVLHPDLRFFSSFGSKGSGHGQFINPWDVAFDSANNVYVTDYSNSRIQVFTDKGEYRKEMGTYVNYEYGYGYYGDYGDYGQVRGHAMITVDSEDIVYVPEYWKCRVSMFTQQGHSLTSFGTSGRIKNPHGIAVDKSGVVYICDYGNDRVQIF